MRFCASLAYLRLALEADEAAAEMLGDGAGRAGAGEGIEHEIVDARGRQDDAREQRLRLLRRMQFLAVAALEAFLAGAQRDGPVGADLDILVAGLEHFVIERVALAARLARRPDQRFMRVGEAAAAEIRHRVGLAPDDVVEDPEAEILHHRADAENVVVGADHPDCAGRLEDAPRGQEPGAGEIVIGRKARELVPVVGDRVDVRIVGTLQIAGELQIVWRVGEDEIDALPPAISPSRRRSRRRRCDAWSL